MFQADRGGALGLSLGTMPWEACMNWGDLPKWGAFLVSLVCSFCASFCFPTGRHESKIQLFENNSCAPGGRERGHWAVSTPQPLVTRHLCSVGSGFPLFLGALAVFETDTRTVERLWSAGENESLRPPLQITVSCSNLALSTAVRPYSTKAKIKTYEYGQPTCQGRACLPRGCFTDCKC